MRPAAPKDSRRAQNRARRDPLFRRLLGEEKPAAFLQAEWSRRRPCHHPGSNGAAEFRCGACNGAIPPKELSDHKCKALDWSIQRMKEHDMTEVTAQGTLVCRCCHKPLRGAEVHRCQKRFVCHTTFVFSALEVWQCPAGQEEAHHRRRRQRQCERAALRGLQGHVCAVLPEAGYEHDPQRARQAGRLVAWHGAIALSKLVPGNLGLYTLQRLHAARGLSEVERLPRKRRLPYHLPLSRSCFAMYTGEECEQFPDRPGGGWRCWRPRWAPMWMQSRWAAWRLCATTLTPPAVRVNAAIEELDLAPGGVASYLYARADVAPFSELYWDYAGVAG